MYIHTVLNVSFEHMPQSFFLCPWNSLPGIVLVLLYTGMTNNMLSLLAISLISCHKIYEVNEILMESYGRVYRKPENGGFSPCIDFNPPLFLCGLRS